LYASPCSANQYRQSTLINCILNEEKAIHVRNPGTTRDVLEGTFQFENKNIVILDTAGIRRKKMVEDRLNTIR